MLRQRSSEERHLLTLIEESEDLQVDAMRDVRQSLPDLRDLANDRRHDDKQAVDTTNRFSKVAAGGAFGLLLTGLLAKSAAADTPLDIQMLQTASSLERLAVNTYEAALTLDFIKNGNAVIIAFAQTTMKQHDEHRAAFIAQTEALGGKGQDEPNPVFQKVVDGAMGGLKAPLDVVMLAATLEKVATDTYLTDLTKMEDVTSKKLMGSVMGVESQHRATLLAVQALLEGGGEAFIAIPTDLANLPAAAGSVAFPDAFETTDPDLLATPESGAL